jgi:hypothetical protein
MEKNFTSDLQTILMSNMMINIGIDVGVKPTDDLEVQSAIN